MATRPKGARDHFFCGFVYDPLVFGVPSHYHSGREALGLLDDDQLAELEQELNEIGAILDARVLDIHEAVRWQRVGHRHVCTCGLVMRDLRRESDPAGHVDFLRWTPTSTVVLRLTDAADYLAACQHCQARCEGISYDAARTWTDQHLCPPDPPEAEIHEHTGKLVKHSLASGEHFDNLLHALRTADQRRKIHPRKDGVA